MLLSHRAFVGAKSKLGMTPLHLAAENGYTSLVEMLVDKHKAQVDANTLVRCHLRYTLIVKMLRVLPNLGEEFIDCTLICKLLFNEILVIEYI